MMIGSSLHTVQLASSKVSAEHSRATNRQASVVTRSQVRCLATPSRGTEQQRWKAQTAAEAITRTSVLQDTEGETNKAFLQTPDRRTLLAGLAVLPLALSVDPASAEPAKTVSTFCAQGIGAS